MKTSILYSIIGVVISKTVFAEHTSLRRQAKSVKVQVCHKTGSDDEGCGWKDLEFDDNGLPGHLGHGDYEGTCASTLCDDQDMCTQDYFDTTNCCTHEPVICATGEVCDTTIGCLDPQLFCDDGKQFFDSFSREPSYNCCLMCETFQL